VQQLVYIVIYSTACRKMKCLPVYFEMMEIMDDDDLDEDDDDDTGSGEVQNTVWNWNFRNRTALDFRN